MLLLFNLEPSKLLVIPPNIPLPAVIAPPNNGFTAPTAPPTAPPMLDIPEPTSDSKPPLRAVFKACPAIGASEDIKAP